MVGNCGHDTAGYCVAVFGAFGPTTQSLVADNLCINNGLSPRLAQRQGAVLLMTWQGGSLNGVEIRGNRVDWRPGGDTPVIQSGAGLQAADMQVTNNKIFSRGTAFVDTRLKYAGHNNQYFVERASNITEASGRINSSKEEGLHLSFGQMFDQPLSTGNPREWQLIARLDSLGLKEDEKRSLLIQIESAALQFGHVGLRTAVHCEHSECPLASDWSLPKSGIILDPTRAPSSSQVALTLIAPDKSIVKTWIHPPSTTELGLLLRQKIGVPEFAFLPYEDVRATD